MKPSDDLYQLIASLTRAEKRYCRLHIARGAGRDATSCLKLFDVIAALPAYDEVQVRKSLKGERFLEHLPVTKNYLYTILLRELRAFNSRKFAHTQVHELIDSTFLLMEKGLMAQATKQIARAAKHAQKHDLFGPQLEINHLEQILQHFRAGSERTVEDMDRVTAETEQILLRARNHSQYYHLQTRMAQTMLMLGKPRTPEAWKVYEDLMNDPLLASEDMALSNTAKQHYYDIYRMYYLMTFDYENGYLHSLRHIALFEELAADGRPNPVDHAAILYTHICICIKLHKLDEADTAYEKMLAIRRPTPLVEAMLQRQALQSIITIHFARKEFAQVAALAREVEELFLRHNGVGMRQARVALPFIIACSCFIIGNYSDAARLLQPLIDEPDPEVRPDLQVLARLLRLMIHYELGNMDLLPYLWRSTYRSLCRRNNLHGLERCMLDFMRRLPGIHTGKELRRAFMDFKQQIEAVNDDPLQTEMVLTLNILPWLQRKVEQEGAGRLGHVPTMANPVEIAV